MADESDGGLSSASIKSKLCDYCEEIIRRGQVCVECRVNYIHFKCVESIIKAGDLLDKKVWRCKQCCTTKVMFEASSSDVTMVENNESEIRGMSEVLIENSALKMQINLLNKIIVELDNVNQLQKKRIEFLELSYTGRVTSRSCESEKQMAQTYSAAVKSEKKKNLVVIKPVNNQQNASDTQKQIKEVIDPTSLTIGINKITTKDNGSVVIDCENSVNADIIKNNINDRIGDKLYAVIPRKINPKVVLFDVCPEDIKDNGLFGEKVFAQNNLQKSSSTVFKIVRVTSKKQKVEVIVEGDPATYRGVMERGFLYIGWSKCKLRESFHIKRCFNCSKYGHFAANCKEAEVCPKCAQEHKFRDCKSDFLKCINCIGHNLRFKTGFLVDHAVNDNNCECYKRLVNDARAMTNYSQT